MDESLFLGYPPIFWLLALAPGLLMLSWNLCVSLTTGTVRLVRGLLFDTRTFIIWLWNLAKHLRLTVRYFCRIRENGFNT